MPFGKPYKADAPKGWSLWCLFGIHDYRLVNVIKGVKVRICQKCGKPKMRGGNQDVGHSGVD